MGNIEAFFIHFFQYTTHVHFYQIMDNTSMLIEMDLITLFRVMKPHQTCSQTKIKNWNEPKQVMPKSHLYVRLFTFVVYTISVIACFDRV